MTRTYAGPYRNPTEGWVVWNGQACLDHAEDESVEHDQPDKDLHGLAEGVEIDPDKEYIVIPEEVVCQCGCPSCKAVLRTRHRLHTSHASGNWPGFEDGGDAADTISSMYEDFEEDYDRYLDENSYEICQMERYEQWRNEY